MLSNAKIQFFSITLQIAKNRPKQTTTLIFFSEKTESSYFTNSEKGVQGKANFSLKLLVKMKKIEFELEFQTKIGFPLPPPFGPHFTNS